MPARFAFPTGVELNKGRAGCCEVGEGCCHCLHGHDSFTHSVSSSITLISSARARFCLHFCQSSFLFSLFPRRWKKNGNGNVASAIVRASTENCENTVTAGDIKQYGMFLISPTVAHLITQSVFFSAVYLSFFLSAPSLLYFFLVYLLLFATIATATNAAD